MSREEYPPAVADRWETVLDDVRATAAEYRDDRWEVLVIHTGDVTPLTDDPFGLDVLAPDDEFDDLAALVDTVTFDQTSVYRADDGGVRFFVTVPEATEANRAVVIPTFIVRTELPALRERATAAGAMFTHVRTLAADRRVTFRHDDPELFF